MAFGKVLAAASTQGALKTLLKKGLATETPVPYLTPDSYIRVSSFSRMCPREEIICAKEKLEREDSIEPDLQLIFAHGHALHWALQNILLPKVDALYGTWSCNTCGTLHGEDQPGKPWQECIVLRPTKCKGCGKEDSYHVEFTYVERTFRNEDYRIQGHPDGFLVVPGMPGMGILEAKSIGAAYKIKNAPQIDHVIQAQCYMWLTGLKWAKIFYWEKGGKGMDALTEHTIEKDEETISEIKKTLLQTWSALKTGILPDRICDNSTCPRAKSCPVAKQCFNTNSGVSNATPSDGEPNF